MVDVADVGVLEEVEAITVEVTIVALIVALTVAAFPLVAAIVVVTEAEQEDTHHTESSKGRAQVHCACAFKIVRDSKVLAVDAK